MKKMFKILVAFMLAFSVGCSQNSEKAKQKRTQASIINVKSTSSKVTYQFALNKKYTQVRLSYANLNKNIWTIYKTVIKENINGQNFSFTIYKKSNLPYKYSFEDTENKGSSFAILHYKYTQKYIERHTSTFNPTKKTPIFGVLDDDHKNNKLSFNDIDNDTNFDGEDQAIIIYIRFIK